jgi:hypothetical protein
MAWDPGPVLRVELLVTARRGRYYAARVAYGLFLLLALWMEYRSWSELDPRFATIYNLGRFAESTFLAFAGGQGLAMLVLVPALVAGTIADERQRNTLPDLLATGLGAGAIVLGKLGARLLHAGVFLLLGLPVVCLVGLFGGLDPWDVLAVTLGTLSVTLFVAGLSILVSVVAPRPRRAIVTAYSLVATWLFVPPMLGELAPYFAWPLAWVKPVNDLVLLTNPMLVWAQMSGVVQTRFYDPSGIDALTVQYANEAFHGLVMMAWLQLVSAALFVVLAVWLLRPFRGVAIGSRSWSRWGGGRRRAAERAAARPPCGDDPMLWKERHAPGDWRSWLSSLPVVLVLGVLVGCYLFDAARPVVAMMARYGDGPVLENARMKLNRELRGAGAFVFAIAGLAVAGAAASSVTEEREQGTWTGLMTTLLTGPEIVRAKLFGAAWGARRLVATVLAIWGVGLLGGAISPPGFLLALTGLLVFLGFAAALGLVVSLKARHTTRALIATIGGLFALNLCVALAARAWDRQGPSLLLAGSAPYVVSAAPVAPSGVRAIEAIESREDEGAGRARDALPIVALGLVAHALAALVLALAAIRAIPAAAVRTPGRRGDRGVPGPLERSRPGAGTCLRLE